MSTPSQDESTREYAVKCFQRMSQEILVSTILAEHLRDLRAVAGWDDLRFADAMVVVLRKAPAEILDALGVCS